MLLKKAITASEHLRMVLWDSGEKERRAGFKESDFRTRAGEVLEILLLSSSLHYLHPSISLKSSFLRTSNYLLSFPGGGGRD